MHPAGHSTTPADVAAHSRSPPTAPHGSAETSSGGWRRRHRGRSVVGVVGVAHKETAAAEPVPGHGFHLRPREGRGPGWRLSSNGLQVLLLKSTVAPVATFAVVYHVGSRNEPSDTCRRYAPSRAPDVQGHRRVRQGEGDGVAAVLGRRRPVQCHDVVRPDELLRDRAFGRDRGRREDRSDPGCAGRFCATRTASRK